MKLSIAVIVALAAFAVPAGLIPGPSAQDRTASPSDVEKTVDETVSIRQNTQKAKDSWSGEEADLRIRYRDLTAKVAYLDERKAVEEGRAAALQASVDELARRLEEAVRLETNLEDTLLAMFRDLRSHVEDDIPFLAGERSRRLASLRADLVDAELSPAEQLRRLLEGLLIEASYGTGSEVYVDEIVVEGDTLAADVLRVGRVALFWRSPDGERAGTYDPGQKAWLETDGDGARHIGLAMQMASGRRMQELVLLPIGRIRP